MCFSATASFTASAVLSGTGVATLKKAKKKREIPFASIPLLFGIQQIFEGGVWLSFKYGWTFVNQITTYSFVSFAYVLWPIFVPFSIILIEKDAHRKRILYVFQLIGTVVGLYLLQFMLLHQISSKIVGNSIWYTSPMNHPILLVGGYILATSFSCLFSSYRMVNLLGVLVAISLASAYYFSASTYISVWCFFSALLSAVIYLYFWK